MTQPLWARQLWLTDFRNYASTEVELAQGLTVVLGQNGQGKSNLLEAVGYAATADSFRGVANEALVRRGADTAVVRLEGERQGREFLIEAEIRAAGRGRVQLNRQRVQRTRDLLDGLLVSVFTPDDLVLVKGPPAQRRGYLDQALVACHPRNAGLCSDIDRILRQKNALLKQARGTLGAEIETTLDVWNEQLVAAGEQLVAARLALVEELEPQVVLAYGQIAGTDDNSASRVVTMDYRSSWTDVGLKVALEHAQDDELRRGVCLVGPQRDDLGLEINQLPSRTHASQGEQRTLALALRLGAHRVVGESVGVHPVLLLDDIFSELDPGRSEALLGHLPPGQVILSTATEVPAGAKADAVLVVDAGRVRDGR